MIRNMKLFLFFVALCSSLLAADCSQLTPEEQTFSNQILTETNKEIFCSKFNSEMRSKAMDLSGQMEDGGVLMTNDEAVEQVAKDNNMLPPPPPPKSRTCPPK